MRSREKVLDLLVKLKAMADEAASNSPEEAAIAAARMQELMFKHKISAAEIGDVEEDEPVRMVDMIGQDKNVVSWKVDLLGSIARANFCRIVYTRASRERVYKRLVYGRLHTRRLPAKPGRIDLFGKQSDIDTVSYMYEYLCKEVQRLTKACVEDGIAAELYAVDREREDIEQMFEWSDISEREYERRIASLPTPTRRKWMHAFRQGCVTTIGARLRAQRKASEEALRRRAPQSTALVLASDQAVDNFVEKTYPRTSSGSPRYISDQSAFAAGRDAGSQISLGGGGKGLQAPAPKLGRKRR